MSRYVPLLCLAMMHALVDACSLLIAPLWPRVETTYGLTYAGLSAAFIVQSLPTNVSQVIFGWLRDRRPMPVWIWLGPVGAAIFLPLMGRATEAAGMFALLAVGGVAVGAFHPEAAVAAGRMLPEARTRGLSLFMLGGTAGMALGPLLSGFIETRWGLAGLALLVPPLLVCVAVLKFAGGLGRRVERDSRSPGGTARRRSSAFEGRAGLAALLLIVCSLRLVPNMAMDKVIAFQMTARHADAAAIGHVQSLFLASTSVGMLGMALWFRPGREKPLLITSTLAGVPLLWTLGQPGVPQWLFLAALIAQGVVLWGTTPAMVSYAQQQFPGGTGFASALTMGLSWGVAGLIQAPITAYFQSVGRPGAACVAYIPCLALSAVGACFLPASRSLDEPEPEVQTPLCTSQAAAR